MRRTPLGKEKATALKVGSLSSSMALTQEKGCLRPHLPHPLGVLCDHLPPPPGGAVWTPALFSCGCCVTTCPTPWGCCVTTCPTPWGCCVTTAPSPGGAVWPPAPPPGGAVWPPAPPPGVLCDHLPLPCRACWPSSRGCCWSVLPQRSSCSTWAWHSTPSVSPSFGRVHSTSRSLTLRAVTLTHSHLFVTSHLSPSVHTSHTPHMPLLLQGRALLYRA